MVNANIPALLKLHLIQHNTELFVDVDDFCKWLKEGGCVTRLNRTHIIRDFERQTDALTTLEGKTVIKLKAIIRYSFNHQQNYTVCGQVCDELCAVVTEQCCSEETLVLDLYRHIARLQLIFCINEDFDIEAVEIPTLYSIHKSEFTQPDWKNICFFEWHFHKYASSTSEADLYEESVKAKKKFLKLCTDCQEIGVKCSDQCLLSRTNLEQRRDASKALDYLRVPIGQYHHSLSVIDDTLSTAIKDIADLKVTCVPCTKGFCTHACGVHVFIQSHQVLLPGTVIYSDIAVIVRSHLEKYHGLSAPELVIFRDGCFNMYHCSKCATNNNVHRFDLRDQLQQGLLGDHILWVSRENDDSEEECHDIPYVPLQDQKLCFSCFKSHGGNLQNALDLQSLDLTQEWSLNVPLPIQILLSAMCINKTSIRRSLDSDQFIQSKVFRLLSLFESIQNIHSRKYTGIIQELNTKELIVNYHSILTVFGITTQTGLSKSFSSSERWLSIESDPDRCYYNTFVKEYPLNYQKVGDTEVREHLVNLLGCLNILYLDNLVRLTTHEDPNPGDNRTSQICTLPITIKGLPVDAEETATWHDAGCLQTPNCACKERVPVNKEDIKHLTGLNKREEKMQITFNAHSTWGIASILEWIQESKELGNFVSKPTCGITEEDEVDQLDATLQSLHLASDDDSDHQDFESADPNSDHEEDADYSDNDVNRLSDISSISTDISCISTCEEIEDLNEDFSNSPQNEEVAENRNTADADITTVSDTFIDRQGHSDDILLPGHFSNFRSPNLLCRHPPPATGRDDDKYKVKEVLRDMLVKLGRFKTNHRNDRILFAPDHKIAKNVFILMKEDPIFRVYLPEFPLLHLKKSKINNFLSAYRNAGLLHLIMFMKDEEKEVDWSKLMSIHHIDAAARTIRRLSLAFHVAFLLRFLQSLPTEESKTLQEDMVSTDVPELDKKWKHKYASFMKEGSTRNGTFALHLDMMKHADEVTSLSVAERLGGEDGYNLLLASVKSSLPFSFLNGAAAYGAFCVQLLHEHLTAGKFHQHLKTTLFSTRHKDSSVNFALDAQREMDHKDAIKGFRPRSTLQSVVSRMAIVDTFTDVQAAKARIQTRDCKNTSCLSESDISLASFKDVKTYLNTEVTKGDMKHVLPTAHLMLRTGGLDMSEDSVPKNVYTRPHTLLTHVILDDNSYPSGHYLIRKYAAQEGLFGLAKSDVPDVKAVPGPRPLTEKLRKCKSVTIKRCTAKLLSTKPSEQEQEEERLLKLVKQKTKEYRCISSKMNACQALVQPDGSKASVSKSHFMKQALMKLIQGDSSNVDCLLGMVYNDVSDVPQTTKNSITAATVEFAGVKFKTVATSGKLYVQHVQNSIINPLLTTYPNIQHLVISEEKYSFTPDDLKGPTRATRQQKKSVSIAPLKTGDAILSDSNMSKRAIISTAEGKRLIGNYLSANIENMKVNRSVTIDIDSEHIMSECQCDQHPCQCIRYTTPVRGHFVEKECRKVEQLSTIKQRKGEAEMAQVDWLRELLKDLKDGEAVLSIVSSADIDSIVIHMFAISIHWPRNVDNTFKHPVYVLLQKKKSELYNITAILEHLEKQYPQRFLGINIAVLLCLGGNDYIPKYSGMSHSKWTVLAQKNSDVFAGLVDVQTNDNNHPISASLNKDMYLNLVKTLYCPPSLDPSKLTLSEVRQLSIRPPGKAERTPRSWMPPVSAIHQIAKLVDCQIQYMFTVWDHESLLPDFKSCGVLTSSEDGSVSYNLGPDVHIEALGDILVLSEDELAAKMKLAKVASTRKKRSLEITPRKDASNKRKPVMSTPKKTTLNATNLPGSSSMDN